MLKRHYFPDAQTVLKQRVKNQRLHAKRVCLTASKTMHVVFSLSRMRYWRRCQIFRSYSDACELDFFVSGKLRVGLCGTLPQFLKCFQLSFCVSGHQRLLWGHRPAVELNMQNHDK